MSPPPVSLLVTCLVELILPEAGMATARLLTRHGVEVRVPDGQTCCGLPLLNSGYRREAAAVARRTIGLLEGGGPVVVPSGSCAWMVKAEYPHLFPDDPEMAVAAAELAARTWELSQYLVSVLGLGRGAARRDGPVGSGWGRVAYHDSCHLLRGLGEAAAPRALLGSAGVEVVALPGADECCGFGGSFSVRLPQVSGAILRRKLDCIRTAGADTVVACDAGCLMQIAGGATQAGDGFRVVHLAELLVEG